MGVVRHTPSRSPCLTSSGDGGGAANAGAHDTNAGDDSGAFPRPQAQAQRRPVPERRKLAAEAVAGVERNTL
jgi:hypothetical protein